LLNKKVVGIILAGGMGTRLKELTDQVAKPAIHFGGKYRIIDFTLSNCTHSGVDTIGIITQYEPLELTSYIGSGGAWDLDMIDGGVHVLPPYTKKQQGFLWQNGTAHAVYQHLNFIDLYNPEYVLILSGDHIYKMDYSLMLDQHIQTKADLTIASITVNPLDAKRFGIIEVDQNNKIVKFVEKPQKPKSLLASMGVYCFSWQVLRKLLISFNSNGHDEIDFGKHVIPYMVKNHFVYAYPFTDYWQDIGTLKSLWSANMELIDSPLVLNLKDDSWPVLSNTPQLPPHHAFKGSFIRKSIVSEGSGVIQSAKFVNGSVIFTMADGKELTPGNISEVLSGSGSTNSLVEASLLIGKTVGYMDGEEEKSGTVVSVSNKEGKLQYILDDDSRLDGDSFISISQ